MHPEMVRCFFQMLSQLEDVQPYEALIGSAIDAVTALLKPETDPTLQPLHLFAAAIANEQYLFLQCMKPQTACTYAGTIPQQADLSKQLEAARQLKAEYQQLCSAYLKDTQFCFQELPSMNQKEEVQNDAANSESATESTETVVDSGLSGV